MSSIQDVKTIQEQIIALKNELDVTIVAHFYQQDSVFELADITGDSLELAKKAMATDTEFIVFCGVGFMGQSLKVLSPQKRVLMPRLACCSMAKMIDEMAFDMSIRKMEEAGIAKSNVLPVVYINSSAYVKAKVGEMGGYVCTSSNAHKIMDVALQERKKIFFLPDRCLGVNLANMKGLKSGVLGIDDSLNDLDVICYDGFCAVHQLFELDDVHFFKNRYPDIKIIVHPECKPEVVDAADFVGSTSQMIRHIQALPLDQKIAVGTEYNLVNRLREKNTYVLSSTRPTCPTMCETEPQDVLKTLEMIRDGKIEDEITVDDDAAILARQALQRMMDLSV